MSEVKRGVWHGVLEPVEMIESVCAGVRRILIWCQDLSRVRECPYRKVSQPNEVRQLPC